MRNKYLIIFILLSLFTISEYQALAKEINTELKTPVNYDENDLFCLAYKKVFETGSGVNLSGSNESEKLTNAKNLILAGAEGYPKEVTLEKKDNNTVQVKGQFITGKSIKDDPGATKELIKMLGNPRVVVNLSEINIGQDVLRSKVGATLENLFINTGYRMLNFPQDFLSKLEERKKTIEIRTTGKSKVAVGGPLNTTTYEGFGSEYILDYAGLVLGRGNDKEAVEVAKRMEADIILVGGAYTIPVELPPAAEAWAKQGYKKARAFLNLQAMVVKTGELVYSNTVEKDAIDFGDLPAGNKALTEAADEVGKELVYKLLENIQVRGLSF